MIPLALSLQTLTAAPSDTCRQETWVTNGSVYVICPAGNRVYIGGEFDHVGPYTGGGVPLSANTGAPAAVFPKFNGTVNAVCPDGNGGWYAGGRFTKAGGVGRNNIAHVLSNGSLDLVWNPGANDNVLALAMNGSTVYAGGKFDSIGGKQRNRIAAIDAATGTVTEWNPSVNIDTAEGDSMAENYRATDVRVIAASGTTVYAGGDFDSIGGQGRRYLAALDAATGNATSWNPNPNCYVKTLVCSGATVYAGGAFDSIGGHNRHGLAALDASTGNVTGWNPKANGLVSVLALSGSTMYAGGVFDSIDGQNRRYLAALDAATGHLTDWNPRSNGWLETIVVSGSIVYAGGEFNNIGGQERRCLAALDVTTGNATAWNPDINGYYPWIQTLAISGATLFAGGNFTMIGGQNRRNIAALDTASGTLIDWNPNANKNVSAIVQNGNTVYVGGYFDSIGGQNRNLIAALDAASGSVTAWNPDASGQYVPFVNTLAISGSTIYAGGRFFGIGGQSRNNIAALDATTGMATDWDPDINYDVFTLVVHGTTVYVGGNFTTIGDLNRNCIAALDAVTGSATDWNPDASGSNYTYVMSLAVNGTAVYAGGSFATIGGASRNSIAALDAITGNATSWNPNTIGDVNCLTILGTNVFAGGYFTGIGGQNRNNIAALDIATGTATSWNPDANEQVDALAANGTTVYASGMFTGIGQGASHTYFAEFRESGTVAAKATAPVVRKSAAGIQIRVISNYPVLRLRIDCCDIQQPQVAGKLFDISGRLVGNLKPVDAAAKGKDLELVLVNWQRRISLYGTYVVQIKAGSDSWHSRISLAGEAGGRR